MSELKDQIEDYHKGKLTPAQMHALEKKALSDSFLADALEGASTIGPDEFADDLGELRSRLQGKRTFLLSWRVAAGVIIVAAGLALVFIPSANQDDLLVQNKNNDPTQPSATIDTTKQNPQQDLLSLEKEDAQPKPDQTSEQRQQPVAPPSTSGTASGPVETSDAEQLTALSKPETEEIAEQKAKAAEGGLTIETDTMSVTVADADDERLAKDAKKVDASQGYLRTEQPSASRSVARATEKRVITGKVTVADDGLPVPGVNVVVKGTTLGATTDLNGNYTIEVPADRSQLTFSFIGMETSEVRLKSDNVVNVQLAEDVSQLSEVVVTGHALPGNTGEPVIKLAEPIGGRRAYDKYLENELRYPQEAIDNDIRGRVTVQFTVDTRGLVGEFEVIKKLGYGCDEEVIRLVKEGPKWLPTTQDNVPTESIVRVRMKFDHRKKKK